MSAFERWQERYNNGWVTEAQLERLVALGVLTQEEYDTIVSSQ